MERLLGFDAQLLFDSAITGLNVLLLFGVLSYFLFNPVKNFLEQRREKIAGELLNAGELQKKAQALKEEYEKKLLKVQWEAGKILEEADKNARRHRDELIREAREEGEEMKARAEKEIALMENKAMEEMKREAVKLASAMAAQVMAGFMGPEVQEQLIDRTLKEMGERRWRS